MTESFLTFQKFNDIELANEISERLKQNNIECLLEDNRRKFFDASFANTEAEPNIIIRLKSEDFLKAHVALEDYYKKQLDTVDKDYYLFEFSDEELIEIIAKPDEWGKFDYQLSQKILRDRGKELKPDTVQDLKTQRIEELSTPEKAGKRLIRAGYVFMLFGGIAGIVIGWSLYYLKKTLPNGQRIFAYRNEDRMHGARILLISTIIIFLVIVLNFILLVSGNNS